MMKMDLSATFLSFMNPGSSDCLLHEEESHREIMEDLSRRCFDNTPSLTMKNSTRYLSHTVKHKVVKQKQWDIFYVHSFQIVHEC